MAFKGTKRTASKAAGARNKAGGVAKKCKTIHNTVRNAEAVPKAVRSMVCDNLVRTFNTYQEERHPLQVTVSELVGTILSGEQKRLQGAINAANANKATLENAAAGVIGASDAAAAAAEAAAQGLAAGKTAVAESKAALRDAKTSLHDLQSAVKVAEAETAAAAAKKAGIETLTTDFITAVKEGTKHGSAAGKHVGKELSHSVEPEFLTCVIRTFSKAGSTWGTFDNIVNKKLEEKLQVIVGDLTNDLAGKSAARDARAAEVEGAKGHAAAAEEHVKAAEEALTGLNAQATETAAAAKEPAAASKTERQSIQKAADACAHAEAALATFLKGPLAAYKDVEAHAPPPAAPEPEQAAPSVEAAMAPMPAPAARASPTIAPSPGILGWAAQAISSIAPSPRMAPSPNVASSPRRQPSNVA